MVGVFVAIVEDLICCYEIFDCNFYVVFLGWLDSEGNVEFIVGICFVFLFCNWVRLYVGVGIVVGFDFFKEVVEIEFKF